MNMPQTAEKNFTFAGHCDRLSAMLFDIRCSCGKKIGRGLGYVELPCRHRKNHGGIPVLVLAEALQSGVTILSVTPQVVEGVTPEMGLP